MNVGQYFEMMNLSNITTNNNISVSNVVLTKIFTQRQQMLFFLIFWQDVSRVALTIVLINVFLFLLMIRIVNVANHHKKWLES